ncbi:MAG: SUMF1/EgtB/PvdO family nonheme iron enzyme, partial [Myxococcales bacterium]|nr:SUMF1/EgtB/PvdO family nonheme iron enzyme [Myxococcales bacterium]
ADASPTGTARRAPPFALGPGTGGAAGAGGGGYGGGGGGSGAAGPCAADMVLAGSACVDRFEAPNVAGVPPLAMQTAYDGEVWCAARGKRLCTDVEWIRACEGASATPYPYGDTWVAHRCNDDKTWIPPDWGVLASWPSQAAQDEAAALYQGDPSGSREACLSEDGAFDLTGNVAEWVVRTIPNANDYDHVMKGCYWSGCYGGTLPNCSFVNPAHPGGFRSYEAGFRCCRDAGPVFGD